MFELLGLLDLVLIPEFVWIWCCNFWVCGDFVLQFWGSLDLSL